MSSDTVTQPPQSAERKRRKRSFAKFVILIASAALAIILALGGWFLYAGYSALPQLDGELTVSGLRSPVTVLRDAQGVPHISAASLDDLLFAQGYVTAQDRLWQMDAVRRYAAGELAEIFGNSVLKQDIRQRTFRLRETAERAAQTVSDPEKLFLESYARGVNAYIDSHRGSLPLEFRVLRYKPRPWTITDSFLIATFMAQMLADPQISHTLERERLSTMIGPELAADLFPNSSWRDHPPSNDSDSFEEPDAEQLEVETAEQHQRGMRSAPHNSNRPRRVRRRHRQRAEAAPPVILADQPLYPGSNNWVVSGAHTATSKPLLSNDMHLPHQVPGIWYEAHLTCTGADLECQKLDVAGVTLPGLPFVISGHNRRIAWGFTNIGPAVQDIYVERFNDKGEYETPEGWKQPERHREVVTVRRNLAPDEHLNIDVLTTRHGPIITPLIPGERRALAVRWTLYEPSAVRFPFFEVNTAQNWDEFRHAFSQFNLPSQNVVYADVDGHIGYQATGRIPIRASGDGSLPVPGNDNSHEWTGYIPFDELPKVFDPPSGIIATANGRITPDGFPYTVSNEWGPPYRTERMYAMLRSSSKLTPADMLRIQTDTFSDFDRFCAERFAYAIDHAKNTSARAKQAAEMMRRWDGVISADSPVPTIVAGSRAELERLLLTPRIGDWTRYRWFMSSVWLENLLLRQPARWLPGSFATYDDLMAAAVERAVTEKGVPRDLNKWTWGKQMPVRLRHPVFGRIPGLGRWASTSIYQQSGNGFTVKQVGSSFGPSDRMTIDFSNFDSSTLNIVSGQSGHIFSPHFKDQWNAWTTGSTFVLPFSSEAVQQSRKHRLVLKP